MTHTVYLTIKVEVDSAKNEDYDFNNVEDVAAFLSSEADYEISIDEPGIKVLDTELVHSSEDFPS